MCCQFCRFSVCTKLYIRMYTGTRNYSIKLDKSLVNLVINSYINVSLSLVNISLQLVMKTEIFGSPIVMKVICRYMDAWHVCWRVTEVNGSFSRCS